MTARSKLRERIIALTKRRLNNEFPRFQISIILLITSLSGFFTSFILLQIGINSMSVRYFLAVVFAYCVFLFLLKIWLWMQKGGQIDLDADIEGVDFSGVSLSSSSNVSSDSDFESGGGGDFGGGGTGGAWSEADATSKTFGIASTSQTTTGSGSGGGSSIIDSADGDDLIWIILAAIALLAAFIAAFYIVYIAPALLAEIFVDGILVTGIYSRARKIERKYWLTTAVKKTILPAIIIALCFGVAGFAMQQSAPEARSIGGFLRNTLED